MRKNITHQLEALAEESYREFTQRLILDGKPLLGVRMAPLRALAKEIAKKDWKNNCYNESARYWKKINVSPRS